jgi:tRNA-specific adenosine deaminase 1
MLKRKGCEECGIDVAIHQCVREAFALVGKHGRPEAHEYTVLAALVLCRQVGDPVLVSLATGTKCLPARLRSKTGHLLNDSHAEVLARRCALHWMYDELETSFNAPSLGALW